MDEQMMSAGGGLAASGMVDEKDEMLQEVVKLLMSGATPQELIQMGVPQAVIDEAMAMIQAQQGSVNGPVQQSGLAGSALA